MCSCPAKQFYFAACIDVCAKALCVDGIIHLTLKESYGSPISTYAIATIHLHKTGTSVKRIMELGL
jgi:hypothetical protein